MEYQQMDDAPRPEVKPWGLDLNVYCMIMHLSQFASFFTGFGGIIMPLIMWQMNKDLSPEIDQHGKNIMNWIITEFILLSIGVLTSWLGVGFIILGAVGIASLIFTLMGAIKANDNIVWRYPFSLQLIK